MGIGKTLAFLVLSGVALLNPLKATAEETIKPKQSLAVERTLEEEISKPKIELIFNYGAESQEKSVDYSTSTTWFYSEWPLLWRSSSAIPELTEIENKQVYNVIEDIMIDKTITSYQELLDESKNLSESQNLVLASVIAGLTEYDSNLQDTVISQDDFFYNLQNSLPVGVCRHIATHVERFLNDIGITSAAVSGIRQGGGHVYDISKTENGTAIIDYNRILITDTKNIEKALQAYQKDIRMTTFQHVFFNDALFEYKLITKDGRRFLDFIEYDESSTSLKNSLINNAKPQSDLEMILTLKNNLTSFEANIWGFFGKVGQIQGDDSSPLNNLPLVQTGFKRDFSIRDVINISPDLSFIYGNLFQNFYFTSDKIFGLNCDLIINTTRQKGFNLSSRVAGNMISAKDSTLFYDFLFGGGIAYSLPIKNTDINPYVVSQFRFLPKDIGTYEFYSQFAELVAGIALDAKFKNTNFSFEPHYIKRKWEQGFGGNIKFKGKNIGINAKGDATWSNYEFNPDKINLKIGPYLNLEKLHIGMDYELERTNYDREIDNQHLFGLEGTVKF